MTPARARQEEWRMLPAPRRDPDAPPERACAVMAAQLDALERDIRSARAARRRRPPRRTVAPAGERVPLRSGRTIAIRPVCATDTSALRSLFGRLGALTRYRRFLAPIEHLTAHQVAFLTQIDEVDHDALLAFDLLTGEPLGVARRRRDPAAPAAARLALVVADSWQGRGVATALVERLALRAHAHGVEVFHSTTVGPNAAARALMRRAARTLAAERNTGWMELAVRIAEPPRIGPAVAATSP